MVSAGLIGAVAAPAAAIHRGATLDCGSDGTYTLKATATPIGDLPSFVQVDLLGQNGKVVGTLVPFQLSINGEPIQLVGNAADPLDEHVGLATCSFTGSNGDYVVLRGLLNLH